MKMKIPYHRTHLSIEIPDENFVCALTPPEQKDTVERSQEEIVEEALSEPIGSPSLEESRSSSLKANAKFLSVAPEILIFLCHYIQ